MEMSTVQEEQSSSQTHVENQRRSTSTHWSKQKEQAAGYWQVKLLHILFLFFPAPVLRILAFPVGFFYFLFSKSARTESSRFLNKAAPFVTEPKTAKRCSSCFGPLRHIVSFSLTLAEKLQAWGGKFHFKNIHFQDDDIKELRQDLEAGKGAFLISSHLGNMDLLRGLASFNETGVSRKVRVTAIVDIKVSANFNRMLRELNPHCELDIISASDIGPATAILLEEKLGAGGLVAIAGDRTSLNIDEKKLLLPFLGEHALFSPGVFHLAAVMKAKVYFIFGMRQGDLSIKPEYNMHIHKSPITFDCSRKERFQRSTQLAASFVDLLENYCKKHPFQWYNFYDFWFKGDR